MRFGVREICDVVFKSLQETDIGDMHVVKGQPVLYIDTAKTSTIEGAATTVYATGGRGNSRLIAWEGEKTLTFTVEDALLSEIGFAILSGAGLFKLGTGTGATGNKAMVHTTEIVYVETETDEDNNNNKVLKLEGCADTNAPIFVISYDKGSFVGTKVNVTAEKRTTENNKEYTVLALTDGVGDGINTFFVDYYTAKDSGVTEIQIDAENFAGFYYVEASTLFRRESDGKDLPAEIVFPKVKIQSNFTFNMASSGDPSTFTFTMDAFPAYTMFEKTRKVLCAIQVVDDTAESVARKAVTDYNDAAEIDGTDVLEDDSNTND